MKKAGLYIAVALWIIIVGKFASANLYTKQVSLSNVFETVEFEEMNTYIEGYGQFGSCYLSSDEKEELVYNVAAAIGVNKTGCKISVENEGNISTTILIKDSINGKVTIKAITEENKNAEDIILKQYVYIQIIVFNNVECAMDYRELVSGMFEAMGIEGNVNVNLCGRIAGNLNYDQRNILADELISNLGAEIVTENRDADLFTIYAYTEGIKPYITIGEEDININISINYDELENMTNIYLSSPINSLDY